MMGDVLEFPMELSSKYGCWEKFKKWPMTDEIHGNSPNSLNFEQWLKSQKGWKFQINLVFEKGPKLKINQKFARGAPNQENRRANDTGVVEEKIGVS